MNTAEVEKLVAKNGVFAVKADKTHDRPDIDQLLTELGNPGAGIPFLAIFPGDGADPITFDGPITESMVLEALKQAGPSNGKRQKVAEMARAERLPAR